MAQHDHRHEHGSELSEMTLRVRALETILTEKGYVDPAALDLIVERLINISKPANEPAKKAAKDVSESIGLMEPMVIGEGSQRRPALTDLALELAQKSAGFR